MEDTKFWGIYLRHSDLFKRSFNHNAVKYNYHTKEEFEDGYTHVLLEFHRQDLLTRFDKSLGDFGKYIYNQTQFILAKRCTSSTRRARRAPTTDMDKMVPYLLEKFLYREKAYLNPTEVMGSFGEELYSNLKPFDHKLLMLLQEGLNGSEAAMALNTSPMNVSHARKRIQAVAVRLMELST